MWLPGIMAELWLDLYQSHKKHFWHLLNTECIWDTVLYKDFISWVWDRLNYLFFYGHVGEFQWYISDFFPYGSVG